MESQSLALQKQLSQYAPLKLDPELTGLSEADKEALLYILKASTVIDDIFYEQVWYGNSALRDWLQEHSNSSYLDQVKWMYFSINKGPWSCLDENKAFLTTADSAVKLLRDSTKPVSGWKGIEYRVAFPVVKPPGASFYPPDMDKMATSESFVGIRDDIATFQVKLFGDHLQDLERNLPLDDMYKSESVVAAPIRVIQLLYNAGNSWSCGN
ncbi:nudix hydrolase 3-like isoform X1 [Ananas comosus]|uniref:Nudix hydrolase 3-like isoform X1 n=1 Tax=Ananas comosus TaxID=4615 RepID=A0A6P5GQ73_ANACO|nr:nudix hydrolase 3-like isoform X1 [Ananas comosus]XP_020110045.1 nudix hydrolase 3-like isoform X1 [Ananas comosus]